MKTAYWLPLLAVAAFAADCEGDIFETDTETDTDGTFEFIINSVNVTCAPGTPDQVTADVEFGGWAETVTLDIVNTGDSAYNPSTGDIGGAGAGGSVAVWDETHVFPAEANIQFAEDGSSDTWQLVLDDVDAPGAQSAGTTTLIGCGDYDLTSANTYASVAFRLSATPDDTSQEDQCAIFGHESATITGWGDCECFEAFLSPAPANPCGDN